MRFPNDFTWGVATAAYQIEGAVAEDGRGESIWDRFSHTAGKTYDGETGDVACDHYHRYAADVDLMADLGIQSYRFSVAWPRLFPTGRGSLNRAGLDFYRRLVDRLLQRGIKPMITLYHWDLPQALEDNGGWANRDTASYFADYAATVFQALGEQVPLWVTHNEPWCASMLGNAFGIHAPGNQDFARAIQVAHHLLLSHGLAVQAFRQTAPGGAQIGITNILTPAYAAGESAADQAAARRFDGFNNRWFLDPVLRGSYPADLLAYYGELGLPLAFIQPGDLAVMAQPVDFLGVNFYFRHRVAADDGSWLGVRQLAGEGPLTEMGWEQVPDCLYDLLLRLRRDYGDLPLYITENGAAFADRPDELGKVADPQRIAYLERHLDAVGRAIGAGVNVKGYYCWSFLDNFEWGYGYSKRFGLVYVDYPTQARLPKASAHWYRDAIARNGL